MAVALSINQTLYVRYANTEKPTNRINRMTINNTVVYGAFISLEFFGDVLDCLVVAFIVFVWAIGKGKLCQYRCLYFGYGYFHISCSPSYTI